MTRIRSYHQDCTRDLIMDMVTECEQIPAEDSPPAYLVGSHFLERLARLAGFSSLEAVERVCDPEGKSTRDRVLEPTAEERAEKDQSVT